MSDYTVTKEIKLTDTKRQQFLEQDQKIVKIKMVIASLATQIQDMQDSLKSQIGEMKELAQKYHSLIENTAKELNLDMDKQWSFNTVELKYILEETDQEATESQEDSKE